MPDPAVRVQQLMTRAVWTCRPSAGLDTAVRIMKDYGCGSVVVVDEHGRPVAMVTDRDACLCALETGRALTQVQVSDAMSREIHTCRPEDLVAGAEAVMVRRQVRRLPVVDARGCLVGIVSLDDIARESVREVAPHAESLTSDEVARTLGGLVRPRVPKPSA
jgi:CBS domain-containing protein